MRQTPGMNDRFCPSCGSRDLSFCSIAQAVEDGWSPEYLGRAFVWAGKIAIGCYNCGLGAHDCGMEGDGYRAGFPTLRQIIEADSWGGPDVNVSWIVRCAIEGLKA